MQIVEIAFFTDHVQQMRDFYQRLLGASPVAESESMAIFLVGNIKIFIHANYAPVDSELPPKNHLAFGVENVDQVCQELVARGLMFEVQPTDFFDRGRSAYLTDPDGFQIEVTAVQPPTTR